MRHFSEKDDTKTDLRFKGVRPKSERSMDFFFVLSISFTHFCSPRGLERIPHGLLAFMNASFRWGFVDNIF